MKVIWPGKELKWASLLSWRPSILPWPAFWLTINSDQALSTWPFNDLSKQYGAHLRPVKNNTTKAGLIHVHWVMEYNKANLRDLIAATGLVISNWIQIVNFSAHVTVKFDGWPCKTIGHLFYATSSFLHHFVPIGEFKLELQSGNAQSGSNSEPCDLEIWWMTLQNNRAPLLCYFQAICIIS